MGIIDDFKNNYKLEQDKIKSKAEGNIAVYSPIQVSTAPPQGPHEVIAVIFSIDAHKEGIFTGANPATAFVGATNKLKEQCEKLGGTAVVSAQFEYRVAVGSGWGSAKQVIEIFAYGTVIKAVNNL
jgi:hypothetical protein